MAVREVVLRLVVITDSAMFFYRSTQHPCPKHIHSHIYSHLSEHDHSPEDWPWLPKLQEGQEVHALILSL